MNKVTYIDIQLEYEKVLLKIQTKVINNAKIKVAFFITQKQLWSAQSVYNELKKNNIFEPIIIVFPDKENKIDSYANTCKSNYIYFESQNMNVIYGYDIVKDEYLSYENISADIVFFDQPYPRLPENLRWPKIYKSSLVCYIPYGYKIASFYESHFNIDLTNSCWAVFAESDWHKEQFCKYGELNGENIVTSGYPKLDVYLNKTKDDSMWKLSAQANCSKIKKVIWAPHWSIDDINYSTFHTNYNYFLDLAKNNKNISWIFKPHQRLKHYLIEKGFMSDKEVNDYYNEWDNLDNGYFYDESDYFELFKTSDALITDCGSFLAEYLPTHKPIIHLINKKSKGYNEIGNEITSTYYKAYNIEDLILFINNVIINEDDYLKINRISKLNFVQPNKEGAGKFICNYLESKVIKGK
jgi:hypothetical protein